ncbi:NnrS family protein [Porticoccaceae bacterium LTM1]|nr:NnrS family protein [Porticoccaceae bacterium LTM1]
MLILPTGDISKEQSADFKCPLFRLAFRPMFLLGSAFSVLSLWIWIAVLRGDTSIALYGGGLWWHSHEMLFGFGVAIVTGFLLTAVQTWTKQPGIKGWWLIGLVLTWLLPRALMVFSTSVPIWLVVLTDLIFLPLAAVVLMRPVIRVKQWRNLFFGPILLVMTLLNMAMHWMVLANNYQYLSTINYAVVMVMTLVMCVMGGRVFPMFTANGTRTPKVDPIPWLEKLSIGSVVLSVLITLVLPAVSSELAATIYFIAGLSNAARALRWRIWVTFRVPLVWSLHLSYWSLALGLVALGMAKLGVGITTSQAIHVITVGAMGGMILAMISRVSLGHTGRMIVTDWLMGMAFLSITLAMLIRVFGQALLNDYTLVLTLAVIFWSVGFGLFLLRYTPILCKQRTDGGPG